MRIFDSDNHYYEPYDAFTRHIEPEFADKAVHVVPGDNGRNVILVGDQPLKALPAHPMDFVSAPGSLQEMFEKGVVADRTRKEYAMKGSDDPTFFDRDARLAFMDAEGIEGCMIYPSLGVMVEQDLYHDTPATYANLRAFNRYLEDDWGYGTDGRIYAAPMLSLLDLDLAVEELERVLAKGPRPSTCAPVRSTGAPRPTPTSTRSGPASTTRAACWPCTPPSPCTTRRSPPSGGRRPTPPSPT